MYGAPWELEEYEASDFEYCKGEDRVRTISPLYMSLMLAFREEVEGRGRQ